MLTLGLSIFALNSLLGVFTIIKKRTLDSFVFGLFAISGGVWALGIYMTLITGSLFWGRLSFSGAILGIGSLFLFALVFPGNKKLSKNKWILITSPIIFFLLASFTNLMVKTVTTDGTTLTGTFGELMPIYRLYIPIYIVLGIGTIIKNYLKTKSSVQKNQLRYVMLGMSLFIIPASATNAILPLWFKFYQLNSVGPMFSVCMIALISYAILRHQLLDIKVVIQRGIIFSALLSTIIITYVSIIFVLEYILQKSTGVSIFISAGITTLFGIFGTPPLKSYFEKVTDHIFFKNKYDYALVLHELSEILNKNTLPDVIITESSNILQSKLKISSVNFSFKRENKRSDTVLDIPIFSANEKIGIIHFGEKLSGDPYTSEDIRLLKTFSSQAATALKKAYLYQEVKDYSVNLEEKVKERTRQIESIQKEQENLMLEISHGLQTPLTIMKGELFLLKKLVDDKTKIESIDKSIDRISAFIYRMLNLAHLKTTEETKDMERISLSETVEELSKTLKRETDGLEITFQTKIEKNIFMQAKRDYVEELISNLISNSIKYIGNKEKKLISLSVSKTNEGVQISVEDSGIGISEENISRLFEKFFRVKTEDTKGIKGTGLGLVICKKIVDLHNGTIDVQSKEGLGTKFVVVFPING